MTPDPSGASSSAYWAPLLEATPRLLGALDREPLSPTWGSFDRDHWAWKFRDFPVTMLQAGVLPLAWLWRTPGTGNPWAGSANLLHWIQGALEVVLARQHRNGAWDTVAPNSQDHGVTLAQCYVLATTAQRLGDACPAPLAERIGEALLRGTRFAARSDEDYAFITNHQALFALAWLRAGRQLGDEALGRRADQVIAGIIAHQSPDGWYAEYGGPDPGYETFALQHLAELERERPSPELSRSVDRSLEFLAHCVQPDGGVGGGHGSRHTVQWYPAGFELLAGRSGVARSIAAFMRPRLEQAQVVTPRTVDLHNLPLLLHSYCLAAEARSSSLPEAATEPLPCHRVAPLRHFPGAGLVVASTPAYFALCGLRKGGVLAVFSRARESLVYEDAGYVAAAGRDYWSSALLGLAEAGAVEGGVGRARSRLGRAPRTVLRPLSFLLLRVLNLTVFRSLLLGRLVRRMIIAKLITGRRPGPLALRREVTFGPDQVTVRDHLEGRLAGLSALWRPRAFTAIHMGSARYYHPRDLVELPEARLDAATARLVGEGAVDLGFSIRFTGGEVAIQQDN